MNYLPASSAVATAPLPARTRPLRERLWAQLVDAQQWSRLRLAVDAMILSVTIALSLLAGPAIDRAHSENWVALLFGIAVLVMLHARPAPDDRLNASSLATFNNVLGVVSLASMLTISTDSILGGSHPVALATRLWLFTVVYLGGARIFLVTSRREAIRREGLATPTLIVGAGVIGSHLAHRLISEPSYGLRPVGYLDADPLPDSEPRDGYTVPVLGTPDDLAEAIASTGARRVILSFSSEPDHVLVEKVRECQTLGVDVSLVPRLYESINERATLDHVGGVPLLTLHTVDPKGWQFAVKHALDRSAALLGLLLMSPVLAVIAAAVKLTSSGPVLFHQQRVGRDGRTFDVLKFRTMIEAPVPSSFQVGDGLAPGGVEGLDRRTPLGRVLRDLSLDELPQLYNVLRGDMSLVGPRPERPEYVVRFARDVARYEDRHRVKSGITGWAQVHGYRGQTSIADRVEWDNYYIQNWSIWLDLRIIFMTIAEVLRFRG
ncbi:MAG TPA: exopolysaccharide biosynthesis polyprenyl glycosylphosphotransferase [Solirubrobacteraceae bacterium]|jgi:exopolysaccharide biosynthesis polyprenyl glycosylphosphotransferase